MQHVNVLISGFDPYDGIDANPAREVPRALAADGVDGPDGTRIDVSAITLPVSFANSWPTLRGAIEERRPDIVIAMGLKHSARGVMMERCATNLMDAHRPDADNARPRLEPIDPDGPAAYWTRLPIGAIIKAFARDGIPATMSSDAGTFVCNTLFYNLLNWSVAQDRALAGFMSLPLVNETPHPQQGLPMAQMVAAGRVVVRETVRYYLRPSSKDILLA
ncbi:pyroglutamyl-peptidase I [Bifidobacterium pullorum subsp. saeculare]|uniref:Pyroglutamyl-peptidase I n=1 Tax=Bifidobacterium pullorum subsp. saeculare TaxID=78257 RepID=A0A939BAY9_9BIFI|nr:pyroglutamyl-peptidase I [Bifidobacterium pullorum]MBM6700386.1 pyroglutamyl-peptidase I [Bifidobacterium pullorum subsp. saeculare]